MLDVIENVRLKAIDNEENRTGATQLFVSEKHVIIYYVISLAAEQNSKILKVPIPIIFFRDVL